MTGHSFSRFIHILDRISNWIRGSSRPHWCSIHHRYYDPQFYKTCPDCFKEEGPFYRGEPASKHADGHAD